MERFAEQAAIAFQTSRLISREHPIFRHLSILHKISDYIQTSNDLGNVLQVVLTSITAGYGLGFNRAVLLVLDERRKYLIGGMGIGYFDRGEASKAWEHDHQHGLNSFQLYVEQLERGASLLTPIGDWAKTLSFLLSEESPDIFSQAVQGRKALTIPPERAGELPASFGEALNPSTPVVVIPLVARDELIGLLVADNKFTQAAITPQDIESLQTFVNTAAIAIDNIKLIQRIQGARERLHSLFKASNALISRDPHQVLEYIVHQTRVAAKAPWVRVILIDEMNRARTLIRVSLSWR